MEPTLVKMPTTAGDLVSYGRLTVQVLAMPRDANVNGDIFGGWVVSHMDIASGIAARDRAKGRVVTVAIDAMAFLRPVKIGDLLCVYTALERIGRTSMTTHVEAWVRRPSGAEEKVTDATFTFVSIDEQGRPTPVRSEEEKASSKATTGSSAS